MIQPHFESLIIVIFQDAVKPSENVNTTTEIKGGSNTSVSLTFSSTSGHVDFAKSHGKATKPNTKEITTSFAARTSKEKTKSNQLPNVHQEKVCY